jgi:hypothetical protein
MDQGNGEGNGEGDGEVEAKGATPLGGSAKI